MLTLIESISLAGDRAKQNDDAAGVAPAAAWVIDGATDLHNAPLAGAASDAAWLARFANAFLTASPPPQDETGQRAVIAALSQAARAAFLAVAGREPAELWKSPLASMLAVVETETGAAALDLGDCRLFVVDASGAAHALGGPPAAADDERERAGAAAARTGGSALLRDESVLAELRERRGRQIAAGGAATLCLNPLCAEQARAFRLALARPAHLLLATDGFSALVDRYGAYDGAGLVAAAQHKGLQELGRELRAIEADDAGGTRHPRWKKSDDATALLLRVS